jgi:hypothetical protein
MTLRPYGVGLLPPAEIFDATLWTKGAWHHYVFRNEHGTMLIEGKVAKDRSGHRNPLHLLAKVMDDAKPQLDRLGLDYITTDYDTARETCPLKTPRNS